MSLPELNSGEVMPEHLGLEFAGVEERVAEGTPGRFRLHHRIGPGKSQGVCFSGKGSTQRKTGVPVFLEDQSALTSEKCFWL